MTNIYAKRKDVDAVQCNDGVNGALTMNSYGYLHVDQNKEIKNNLDEIKSLLETQNDKLDNVIASLEDLVSVLEDVHNSIAHSLKVSVL